MTNEELEKDAMPQDPNLEEEVMDEEAIDPVNEEPQTPRGRQAAIERWRQVNQDAEADPEDDDLYDFALNQADDFKGKYDQQSEVNEALANKISQDPKLGALISGIMEDKHPAYVLAKLYGKNFLEDKDALQALNDGYAEYLEGTESTKRQGEEAQENFLESMERVDAYAEENGLGEEKVEELRMNLVQAADDMINGKFSDNFIKTVAQGLTYEEDVQEAADTGFVEGKNEKVSMKFGRQDGDGMPSMGNKSNSNRKPSKKQEERQSFFDGMEAVE